MRFFSRLLSLHSAPVPLEDFFTEVIAQLFSASPQTCLEWVEHARLSDSKYDRVRVSTQEVLDSLEHHTTGSRPDMRIELSNEQGNGVLLIESKIGSREGSEQLRRYAELLENMPDIKDKTLVYITRDFDPKDPEEILANVNDSSVNFVELRWHSFYSFLRTQPKTMLIDEILLFMEERGMAQSNQFTPVDVLALSNLTKTLSMMDETMYGEVSARFEEVTGDLRSRATTLSRIQEHNRYLLYSLMQQNWSFWCGIGYQLQPGIIVDYPAAGLILEVSPTMTQRQDIIGAMREIAENRGWYSWNLSERTWSGITRERSLRDFLSSPDHVAEIKKFFLESLDELQEIKTQYPHLPWDGSVR